MAELIKTAPSPELIKHNTKYASGWLSSATNEGARFLFALAMKKDKQVQLYCVDEIQTREAIEFMRQCADALEKQIQG